MFIAERALAPERRRALLDRQRSFLTAGESVFREWADAGLVRILTKKPLQPSDDELHANPRARSAKLRVVERVA